MSIIDKILGWVMVALGVAHSVGTFALYKPLNRNAAWFFGSGVALVAVGMLNLVRARKSDAFTRGCSVIANSLALILTVAVLWSLGRNVMDSPQAIAVGVVIVLELIFSAGK
ncbi:MAG TPA: hypothetical protein VN622_08125 [Clostridia bacterium]|nr:hypothetical protein [Clostridia bacterium]